MHYKSKIYQLNSLRLGLIHEDNIYGKPTIFFTIGSQDVNAKQKVQKYIDLNKQSHNCIAIPFDINNLEPGDNYDIISFYENVLGIKFYVTEKINQIHMFFKNFGLPTQNFTEYHFDAKTKFVEKRNG